MLTDEQFEKSKAYKSVEKTFAFAKENGVTFTEEQEKQFFAELHKTGKLTDDALEKAVDGIFVCYFYICPYCRYLFDSKEMLELHIQKCKKSAKTISKNFV